MIKWKKKILWGVLIPWILLGWIIVFTAGLYWYNSYLTGEINTVENNIKTVLTQIDEVKKDPKLQVFNLLEKHKKVISTLNRNSQIPKIIKSLNEIEDKYGLIFDKIGYANGIITLNSSTSSKRSSEPYRAVSDFIKKYREDKDADFLLPFVSKFTGSSEMKMPIILELTDNILGSKDFKNKKISTASTQKEKIIQKINRNSQTGE